MDFLQLKDKNIFITGIANKKSIAFATAKVLELNGANLLISVQNKEIKEKIQKHFPKHKIFICDLEKDDSVDNLKKELEQLNCLLDGLLHSVAFADFSQGAKPFHETKWEHFQRATNISAFSLVRLANSLKDFLDENASVVTVSISDSKATAYGYMGPIKESLNSMTAYLAKSFSSFSSIRFNSVLAGPLKTSASAGIPGYIDNYLFAEKLTMRKKALETKEVANTIAFLLSMASSGINASGIRIDAGMRCNHFDAEVVKAAFEG